MSWRTRKESKESCCLRSLPMHVKAEIVSCLKHPSEKINMMNTAIPCSETNTRGLVHSTKTRISERGWFSFFVALTVNLLQE